MNSLDRHCPDCGERLFASARHGWIHVKSGIECPNVIVRRRLVTSVQVVLIFVVILGAYVFLTYGPLFQ